MGGIKTHQCFHTYWVKQVLEKLGLVLKHRIVIYRQPTLLDGLLFERDL